MKYLSLLSLSLIVVGCQSDSSATSGSIGTEIKSNYSTGTDTNAAGNTPADSNAPADANAPAANTPPAAPASTTPGMEEPKFAKPKNGEEVAVITTKFGKIVLKFRADKAPKHVENFKKLANKGFYDGTIFHRVIPGFMIQGGDPNTKDKNNTSAYGQGGPGYMVDQEFNNLWHRRGVLSMARSQDPNSAGSQFFICTSDAESLNNQYTAFGEAVEGLDVADKIVNSPRNGNDMPDERIEMKIKIAKWPVK